MDKSTRLNALIFRFRKVLPIITLRLLQVIPIICFLGLWHLFVTLYPDKQFTFSSPQKVLNSIISLTSSNVIYKDSHKIYGDMFVTSFEAIAGFLIGTTSGAIIGLSLWYSTTIARIARPYIIAIGSVPIFVLAPVMIHWFGIGIFSKVMMAALSTVVVAIVQAYQGACSVDEKHLRLMEIMGASRAQTFKKVVIPSALIWVTNSMKLNIGFALLGAFIGEFISAEKGLGYLIVKAAALYDMATVFAGCLALIAIALVLTRLIELLERSLLRWRFVNGKNS